MLPIIEVKNLGKQYIIGESQRYLALRDTLTNIIKSPLSWLGSKVKKVSHPHTFWALKDVSFTVDKGEVLGIIGRNGAGKSTLLKVLSQITPPTTGEIKLRGRVGSLLEVGTGFHPELTGRENIFLNGAILGMRKKEIKKKFDEIVAFSGIEQFLDTPVKRYSSGMYVRLAFSVAAHLEPDILIVDEVLAVGDAEFQKKCLGKMEEVVENEGRTVLFVSHNMLAIQRLCSQTILLENAQIKAIGNTDQIVQQYINDINAVQTSQRQIGADTHNKDIAFSKIWVTDVNENITNRINVEDAFKINLEFSVNKPIDNAEISLCIKNSNGVNVIFTSLSDSCDRKLFLFEKGSYKTSTLIKGNFLMPDSYSIIIEAHVRGIRRVDYYEDILRLIIVETGNSLMAPYGQGGNFLSCVLGQGEWNIEKQKL